ERSERAGSAGDDRGLAADVEQRERVLQEFVGHFFRPLNLLRPSGPPTPDPSPPLRGGRGTQAPRQNLTPALSSTSLRCFLTDLPGLAAPPPPRALGGGGGGWGVGGIAKQQRRNSAAHFPGATATRMVHPSLPRLMISRLSFEPMTHESFCFSTVSLPPT